MCRALRFGGMHSNEFLPLRSKLRLNKNLNMKDACYYPRWDLYSYYRILAGQSGRFAFDTVRRTFGLSYHYIDEPS